MTTHRTLSGLILSIALVILLHGAQASLAAQPFAGRVDRGVVDNAEIDEASGIACSHIRSDLFWIHNDSGDKGRVFAVDSAAHAVATYYLKGIENRDWEDICSGMIDGKSYLFVGEIGDNNAQYPTKMIYRFAEPQVKSGSSAVVDTISDIQTISFEYPDGVRDAECLMFDPQTKDLYIISKREDSIHVYQLPYPQATTGLATIQLVAVLPYTFIVGGDISTDGTEILIKDYSSVYYFKRNTGQTISAALKAEPQLQAYEMEPQGEAICFDLTGSGYYTVSEMSPTKTPAQLYYYSRLTSSVDNEVARTATVRIDSLFVNTQERSLIATFHCEQDIELTLQLFDLRGRSVLATPHMPYRSGGNDVRLPLNGLRSGTYVLHILGNGCNVSRTVQFVK